MITLAGLQKRWEGVKRLNGGAECRRGSCLPPPPNIILYQSQTPTKLEENVSPGTETVYFVFTQHKLSPHKI